MPCVTHVIARLARRRLLQEAPHLANFPTHRLLRALTSTCTTFLTYRLSRSLPTDCNLTSHALALALCYAMCCIQCITLRTAACCCIRLHTFLTALWAVQHSFFGWAFPTPCTISKRPFTLIWCAHLALEFKGTSERRCCALLCNCLWYIGVLVSAHI